MTFGIRSVSEKYFIDNEESIFPIIAKNTLSLFKETHDISRIIQSTISQINGFSYSEKKTLLMIIKLESKRQMKYPTNSHLDRSLVTSLINNLESLLLSSS